MKFKQYITTELHNQSRLDIVLSELMGKSRSSVAKLIKQGLVLIDDQKITETNFKIKNNVIIKVTDSNETIVNNDTINPKKIDLEIIYEDDDILLINKQAGLTVHPGAGNYDDTLVNGLKYLYNDNLSNMGGEIRAGIVHRIDKDTSGVLVIAKTNDAHVKLSDQIQQKEAYRKYVAIVFGVPKPFSGLIETQIARSHKDRTKMTTVSFSGKYAATEYSVKEIFCNGLFSLIECRLLTGRTHQIRVHMSHIGHSIVGDQTYGHNSRKIKQIKDQELQEKLLNFKRQALHAYSLSFIHPSKDVRMEFKAEISDDIKEILSELRSRTLMHKG